MSSPRSGSVLTSASFIALILAAFLVGSCSSASSSKLAGAAAGMNVLVITLDTTRADAIGLYGNPDGTSPVIDRLGREGLVFKNCYTPAPLTLPAHCSIFTGRPPIAHGVRNNGTYVLAPGETTMAEIFKDQGYQTGAVIASFTVASKFGLAQGFDSFDEDFETGTPVTNYLAEIPADRVAAKFLRWLDGRSAGRFFGWVHFYDPHAPYVSHGTPSGKATGAPGAASQAVPSSPAATASSSSPRAVSSRQSSLLAPPGSSSAAALAPEAWRLYEGEVRFVDEYVGKIVDALRTKGLLDNTLIVIAGDHGEAFGEHTERGHGIFCYEESLRVPLVIYGPKAVRTPGAVETRVSLIDVLPTVLDLCRIKTPPQVEGRSALELTAAAAPKPPRTVYFESLFGEEEFNWAPITGVIDGGLKFISLPKPELYDLPADRGEKENLAAGRTATARELDKKLAQFVRDHAGAAASTRRSLAADDVEKLRALGYVSSFSSKSPKMADPKDEIGVYIEVKDIQDLLKRRNPAEAGRRLKALQAQRPGLELPDLYDVSYEMALEDGKPAEAVAVLRKAIARYPERVSLRMKLVTTLIGTGDLDGAAEACREILTADDKMPGAYVLLGDVEDRLGHPAEALKNYQAASTLDPQNGTLRARVADLLVKTGEPARARAVLDELRGRKDVTGTAEYLDAVSGLGMSLFAAGETDKALELFRQTAEENPGSPAVWVNLGGAYFGLKQYAAAMENFEKALAIDKGFAPALSNIGLVHLSKAVEGTSAAEADAAVGYFDKAIALEPGLASAWNGRASARMMLAQTPAALRDYEQALKLDPYLLDAYVNITIALRELGRPAEALRWLDICREKLYPRLPAREREEIDRLYEEIKAQRGAP